MKVKQFCVCMCVDKNEYIEEIEANGVGEKQT